MSLALLTLGLPCARPAHAQGGTYPGAVGWVAQTPVVTGTVTSTSTDAQGHTTTEVLPYSNDGSSPGTFVIGPGTSATYQVKDATVTYTWKWSGGTNNVPPPTIPQYIRKQARVVAYGTGDARGTVTATASDGMGDDNPQRSVSADGTGQSVSETSSGVHLVTLDGSSGTLTVVGNLSAEMDLSEPASSGGYPGGGYPGGGYPGGYPGSGGSSSLSGSATCYFTAALDDRSVVITCPALDPTKSKQPDPNHPTDANGDPNYIGVPHVRAADGTMSGDVGLPITPLGAGPEAFTAIAYHANLTGTWQTAGSSYNWFSSLKQQGDNGSLYPPDFTNAYLNPWWVDSQTPGVPHHLAFGETGKQDHINIKCTDGGDGATATANYYMTLHPALENNYPDHMTRGIENVRQAPSSIYGRSTQDGSPVAVYAENGSTWGVTATTDGPYGDFIAGILGVNLSVSYSYTYNAGVQCSLPSVPAGYGTYMEFFDAYKYHTGKVDQWGMEGYAGTSPYRVKEADSPSGGIQAHYPPIALP